MNLNGTLTEAVKMFDHANHYFYDDKLPTPMLVLHSGGKKAKERLGYFTTSHVWTNKINGEGRYEICLISEHLNRSVEELFETVLHESVHLYNRVNEIKDVAGIHHSKKYKVAAESHGLDCKYSNEVGWAFTSLNEAGKRCFTEMKIDESMFEFSREFEAESEPKEKQPRLKYECECGTKISRKEPLDIHCNVCDTDFQLVDEEGED